MDANNELYNKTVLIVDDTPENIDVLLGLLVDFKKKVAINGKKALSIVKGKTPPDIILLDVMMPEMDGYEVCKEIRKNKKYDKIPIIFLTAKAEKSDIIKGFEVGGQDYVTKPFDGQELLQRVKTNLEVKIQREILSNLNKVLDNKVQERTTELEQAYAKLDKAMQSLKSVEDAKNSFLSMISHEIRTPLNGIVGATELLSNELAEDSKFDVFLKMLQDSSERLERFSNAALLITQLQSENFSIELSSQPFVFFIKSCLSKFEDDLNPKNLSIDTRLPDKEIHLNFNSFYLEKAINNVILNAIKYTKNNTSIFLSVTIIGKYVHLNIIDQGSGFSDQALKQLFETFSIDSQIGVDQSFGLSLRATKLIIDGHHGKLSISNLKNRGASLKIKLPL